MWDHQEGVVLNDKPELSTSFYDILRRSSYDLPVNELIIAYYLPRFFFGYSNDNNSKSNNKNVSI